jgi:hypothetical protein
MSAELYAGFSNEPDHRGGQDGYMLIQVNVTPARALKKS